MAGAWLREERADVAVGRILDGAGEAFAALGVRAATMADVARFAGCSRGTLYRYFGNRRDLDLAFVNREAARVGQDIGARVSGISDPSRRLVEAVLLSVQAVRSDPRLAIWFTVADSGVAGGLGRDSTAVDAIASDFVASLRGAHAGAAGAERTRDAARWIIRCIVSLLSMPGEDADEERRIVEHFVVPPVVGTDR